MTYVSEFRVICTSHPGFPPEACVLGHDLVIELVFKQIFFGIPG
jgi:hypothetical protein